jgi:hypothetical protein
VPAFQKTLDSKLQQAHQHIHGIAYFISWYVAQQQFPGFFPVAGQFAVAASLPLATQLMAPHTSDYITSEHIT